MNRLSRLNGGAMPALLLIAFALGALKLNADNLWLDELYSLSNMGVFEHPYRLTEVIDSLNKYSPNHVPLYFFVGGQWARLVGWGQLPMRYLSLLFGILFVAGTYRFAADAFNRATATLAALLLTTSGFVLLYFHEIRMYSLMLLLAVVHSWLYWRLATRERASWRAWLLFIITASALLYSHVFAAFFFLGLGLQHLIFAARIKRWRQILLAWVISALTFLPYLPRYLQGALAEQTIASLQETALSPPEIASGLAHIIVNGVELLWLPLLALAGLALWQGRAPKIMRFLVIWAGTVLSLILFNEFFPLIDRLRFRFFLASMPFFAIICAHFLLALGRMRLVAAAFLLIWIAGGLHIYGLGDSWSYAGRNSLFVDIPPLYQYADALSGKSKKLDKALGFSRSKFVDWPLRHGKSIADYYFGALLKLEHAFIITEAPLSNLPDTIEDWIDDHPYLLLAYEPGDKPVIFDDVLGAIQASYTRCKVIVDQEKVFVQRYVDESISCDRQYQPIHYDNGIKLVDRFGDYDSDRESLRLVTGWEVAHEAQLEQYNVSIQVLTADGSKIRQAGDRHLYDDILKWHEVEMSTAGLPPGDYQAVIILYDRFSKAKAIGREHTTGETGAMQTILNFSVGL